MAIRDLSSHHARYVTIAELAEYWGVSRQQIYKRIETGALDAIQLGSRLVRVSAAAALEYARRAQVTPCLHERQIRHHRPVVRPIGAAGDRAYRNEVGAHEDPIDPDERAT